MINKNYETHEKRERVTKAYMSKRKAMDLITGRPILQILLFSLPLVLGTLFQQLYSFADTIMVGRLISKEALAAVGATYSLNFLTLGFVQGACVGFGIPLAQAVGAKNKEEFKRFFWNGCYLCLAIGLIFTVGTYLLASPLLKLIHTPEDIFMGSARYIKIIFLGIPASILYNYCSGVLRAEGDSRHPFYFLIFSSVINIVLDYVLIVPIPMGISGAALATVISQLISGLLNLYWIVKKTDLLHDSTGYRGVSGHHCMVLSRVGLPMGLEYSVSAIGAVVMQGAINALGTVAVAGQTAGEKIRQMFTLPMESVGMGMATYVGQNDGAKRYDRIKEGIRAGITIQLIYCVFAWIAIFFGKNAFTTLVLGQNAGEAGELSVQYLAIMSALFCIHGSLMIMRNTLQGMGYSMHAVFSGVGELLGRSLGGWLSIQYFGYVGICLANPLAWGLALIYCCVMVAHFLRKRLKVD